MKKIYGTYRAAYYNKGEGMYTPSVTLWQQFSDYAWLTIIHDMEIPEERFTYKNPNGILNKTRFMVYEYHEGLSEIDLKMNIKAISSLHNIEMFETTLWAIEWIKKRTDLEEISPGEFLIHEAEEGMELPRKTLKID